MTPQTMCCQLEPHIAYSETLGFSSAKAETDTQKLLATWYTIEDMLLYLHYCCVYMMGDSELPTTSCKLYLKPFSSHLMALVSW